ncbi:kinase-like domain-containing protein [Lasiosphaeria ovina]|uniref:Kinase-like domain-containing protein n=1 Tax=Lasiosphaeria ovina TaxID=92902 RepID=A0AAE0JUH7_9PEZI|nr:kinase-like domain-containing protein [Lasiosphaeria ovina]
MASQNRPLPELVRDWRLQATIQQNGNVTTHTRPPTTRETWTREKRLGRGGYGDVWLERKVKLKGARGSHTADLRAVKCLEISNRVSHSDAEHFYYFVKFFGWYKAPGSLYIAMEYCEHGDLRMYLADHKTIPEDQVQVVVRQVLGALSSMHKEGFVHRDLKPANILIKTHPPENEWWVKVCDLGLSKRAEGVAGGLTTTMRGTENFMAPETKGFPFTGDPRTADLFRADIWSLGETVFRALTGHGTFEDPAALLDYQQGKHNFPLNPLREAKASPLVQSFVVTLMSPLPKTRPEAPDALRHPWIKQGDEPSLILLDTEPVYQRAFQGVVSASAFALWFFSTLDAFDPNWSTNFSPQ